MKLAKLLPLALAVGTLAAAGAAFADGSRVALGGYCPVAYVEMKQAVYGDADFAVTHDGVTYHVVDAKAKAMFEKDPDKYARAVHYDAWCATAMAMGKWVPSEPGQVVVQDGAVYLFSSAEAKTMFEKDVAGTIKKADANWKKMSEKEKK